MTSTTKRAKCLSGSHSSTDGGRRYAVARSIVRKLLKSAHPETKKGRINVSILPDAAQCAKSDRLLGRGDVGVARRLQIPQLRHHVLREQPHRALALLARGPVLAGDDQQRAEAAGLIVEFPQLAG